MNALAFAQVEHFGSVVAKGADEQSFVRRVQIEMIDPSFHSGERDRLLRLKQRITGFRGAETIANYRDDDGKS